MRSRRSSRIAIVTHHMNSATMQPKAKATRNDISTTAEDGDAAWRYFDPATGQLIAGAGDVVVALLQSSGRRLARGIVAAGTVEQEREDKCFHDVSFPLLVAQNVSSLRRIGF